MGSHSDGVIKYQFNWTQKEPDLNHCVELLQFRDLLFGMGLIGYNQIENVGYGNLSIRVPGGKSFLISGTQTGNLAPSRPEYFTTVTEWNLEKNFLNSIGPVKASSESLSHAAIYDSLPFVNAVIHIHAIDPWKKLVEKIPATNSEIEYGTSQMAEEIKKCVQHNIYRAIAMKGHEGGIISFGINLAEAFQSLMAVLQTV